MPQRRTISRGCWGVCDLAETEVAASDAEVDASFGQEARAAGRQRRWFMGREATSSLGCLHDACACCNGLLYNPAILMKTALQRRIFLAYCSRAGFAATLFPGVLWALNEEKGPITKELIGEAATVAGIAITPEQGDMMLKDLNDGLKDYEAIHALKIPNDVPPAFRFDPVLPGMKLDTEKRPMRMSRATVNAAPGNLEDGAFYTVRQWAELIRTKKVSAVALTEMYIERLKRYDPVLLFNITLTDERAMAQAREADKEIAAGKY